MFRLLGFLIGSVAAITIILLVLGIPDFHLADPEFDQQRFDAAVEKLKEKQQVVAEVTEDIVENVAATVDELQDNIETVAETAVPELTALLAEESASPDENFIETIPDVPDLADDYPVLQEELQWYSFWNPFRSEIAARGFVTQLEKVTGLDYRVVKVK
ncbi:MAG: YtxH domain-containing protein, partial [Gammaproteobacteria bacterium]|nr:YtxH domain-containing protein [Gammaproteobacteria bacterium]